MIHPSFVVAAVHFDSFHSSQRAMASSLSSLGFPLPFRPPVTAPQLTCSWSDVPFPSTTSRRPAAAPTASSEMHLQTVSTCCFHVDCPLMRAEMSPPPFPPPQGRLSQSRRGPHCRSISCRALRAERRMPREPGTPCCSEAWRRSKHAALPRRGTRSPMARLGGHGQHCAQQGPKVPSPMGHGPFHAHCPLTRHGPRSVPDGGVGSDSIAWNSSSPPPPTSHLTPECLDLFHRFSRRPFMKGVSCVC